MSSGVSNVPVSPVDSDDEEEVEQLQYKIVLLGDGAVGKTSIISRFCDEHFARQYKQTIGVDFFIKRLVLPGDIHVALQIWDIGGQTLGSKMIGNYIYGAQAILFCYDITNYQSFQDLEDWLSLVKRTFDHDSLPYLALLANKGDLNHLRVVKPDAHQLFTEQHSLFSYHVSAKTGDQVSNAFLRVAADLAGIVLTKNDLDAGNKVLKAEIINHPQHDPAQEKLVLKDNKKKCIIQ